MKIFKKDKEHLDYSNEKLKVENNNSHSNNDKEEKSNQNIRHYFADLFV